MCLHQKDKQKDSLSLVEFEGYANLKFFLFIPKPVVPSRGISIECHFGNRRLWGKPVHSRATTLFHRVFPGYSALCHTPGRAVGGGPPAESPHTRRSRTNVLGQPLQRYTPLVPPKKPFDPKRHETNQPTSTLLRRCYVHNVCHMSPSSPLQPKTPPYSLHLLVGHLAFRAPRAGSENP